VFGKCVQKFDNTADDIAYRLRSRLVSGSEREAETDERKRKRQSVHPTVNI
jgi:hypothetical protein